ncbi:hypothetical protein DFH94DRAFT_624346 [Russula ochroleuca]|uniref:DUF7719 domain-containing protein n=1 Tax=Russula ochroleuca TaxID=152965 RepID=A0A9P5N2X6_9AGAM|nr:hypothetical protein DFH94DRAFT_624346 [Russula ochroleuca]
MAKRKNDKNQSQNAPELQVSTEEQWRLIEQSGILKKVPASDRRPTTPPQASQGNDDEEEYPLAEEIFAATTLLIPISFLLLMMYILIHFQYGQQPSWDVISERMLSGVPILAIFVFYTNRYKSTRWMQAFLFVLSVASGTRMIYQVNYSNWRVNMQQCPPLGTIWVYTVLQLDLGPAVTALSAVALWVWWTGTRIVFN